MVYFFLIERAIDNRDPILLDLRSEQNVHARICTHAPIKKEATMSLVVKEKQFELMSEGLHNVIVSRIDDVGPTETAFGVKDKARIFLTALDQRAKDGGDVDVMISVNKVLGPKSTLSKVIEKLGITAGAEFDLNDLLGIKAQGIVEHNKGNNGKVYANISLLKNKTAPAEV